MEKIWAVETNRGAVHFAVAPNKKLAEAEAAEQIIYFTRMTTWEAEPLDEFLKAMGREEFWLERAREYVIDEVLLHIEYAIVEKYGPDGEEIYQEARRRVTDTLELEAPYQIDTEMVAVKYLQDMGEDDCAEIVLDDLGENG